MLERIKLMYSDVGPVYTLNWGGANPVLHYSWAPKLVLLATFLGMSVLAFQTRSWGRGIWFFLLGLASLLGIPLELTGTLLILTYVFWLYDFRYPHVRVPLLLGGIGLITAVQFGFPQTWVFNKAQCIDNMHTLQSAVEKFAHDHQNQPPRSLAELAPTYTSRPLLHCAAGYPDEEYYYEACGSAYTILCNTGLHFPKPVVGHLEPTAESLAASQPAFELVSVSRSRRDGRIVLEGRLRVPKPGNYTLDARSEAVLTPKDKAQPHRPGSVYWDNEPDDSGLYPFQASWPENDAPHLELRLKESWQPVAAFQVENKTSRPHHKPVFREPDQAGSWYPAP